MAMEKLILRSVMYGADKIPDSWFEKVPGGYFKAKEQQKQAEKQAQNDNSRRSGGTAETQRSRGDHSDRRYRSDDRSRRERDRRSRSSYDGGADDDYYHSDDDRQRRRRSDGRRRRHSVDNDRYGHGDGYGNGRASRDGHYDDRRGSKDDRDSRPGTRDRPPNPYQSGANGVPVAAGAAAGLASARGPPYPQSNPASPTTPQSAQFGNQQQQFPNGHADNAYVPYADIYGPPARAQTFPPPPPSGGSSRPTTSDSFVPPVHAPPSGYHQNPVAQDAPTAAAAGAGMDRTGQPGVLTGDPRYTNAYDPRTDPYMSPRAGRRYDENDRPYSSSSQPKQSRQDGSRSSSSHSSQRRDDDNDRRTRPSDRRNNNHDDRRSKSQTAAAQGKPLTHPDSSFSRAFDKTPRGVGMSTVGAIAGGIIGSGVGHGPVPSLVGAGLGGLGANTISAREGYVDHRYRSPPMMPPQPQSPQTQTTTREPPSRKDNKRETEYRESGAYERGNARREQRRREQGYYSD